MSDVGHIFGLKKVVCWVGYHVWIDITQPDKHWWMPIIDGKVSVCKVHVKRCVRCGLTEREYTCQSLYPNR